MKLVDSAQMRQADASAIEKYGIPGIVLMESAAEKAFVEIEKAMGGLKGKQAVILCGPGNNGGDGYALARKLLLGGCGVMVHSVLPRAQLPEDTRINRIICENLGIPVHDGQNTQILAESIGKAHVTVDALLGTGTMGPAKGWILSAICTANVHAKFLVALDVPSGLPVDGKPCEGECIHAHLTVCFGRGKAGLFSEPGFLYAGNIVVREIGIPSSAYPPSTFFAYDREQALEHIRVRKEISSKSDYGKVLVIAGSPGMTGAMSLCVEACIRSGAGVVYRLALNAKMAAYDSKIREAVVLTEADGLLKACEGKDVLVIGPGLSPETKSHEIVREVLENTSMKIIADAQSLNDLASHKSILQKARGRMILTPHPGEMARLTGKDIPFINANRMESAASFAREHGVVLVLKGHKTVTTDGRCLYLNTTGNPGMATGGSGDVLSGMMGAYAAGGMDLLAAAGLSVYIHGSAGDRAAMKYGMTGLRAGDIMKQIAMTEKELYEEKTRPCMGGDQS
ncbi:MAG: NAD(P)H-hydrate dehydratase [Clostridia bacterium]